MAVPQPTVDACDEGAVKHHTETATEPSNAAESTETSNCREDRPWPVLDGATLHGLAGDVVKALNPHTEADPVSILVQFSRRSAISSATMPIIRSRATNITPIYSAFRSAPARKGGKEPLAGA